jgi:hypothetical protein
MKWHHLPLKEHEVYALSSVIVPLVYNSIFNMIIVYKPTKSNKNQQKITNENKWKQRKEMDIV